jgi:hypothetical protein
VLHAQAALGPLAVRDVAYEGREGVGPAHAHGGHGQLGGEGGPVAPQRLHLHPAVERAGLAALQEAAHLVGVLAAQLGRQHQVHEGPAHHLLARAAEDALGLGVPEGDPAAAIHGRHRLQRPLQDGPGVGLLLALRGLAPQGRHLQVRAHAQQQLAVGERLDQEVVGPGLQGLDAGLLLGEAR